MKNKCIKELKELINNMRENRKLLSIEIKLPTNQKDDAQKVKEYVHERVSK